MTTRKTLQLRSSDETADAAPAIKKKGRGWEISERRLDALHSRARDMRRHPSDAHKALAERFAKADLGRYSFKRLAVVGSAIVDQYCQSIGLAIVIDEAGQNETLAKRRDKSLSAVGIHTIHIADKDILENMDDVLAHITVEMRNRIEEKRSARRAHYEGRER